MGEFNSIEEARDFFTNDRFATVNGMHLDGFTEEGCICSMEIREDHRNALGGVMGGVIYTLADFAFAIACNNDHRPTVGLDGSIHYLSPTKGFRLTARAVRVKNGRTTSVYNVTVTDDKGKEVALFTGTGYKLEKKET